MTNLDQYMRTFKEHRNALSADFPNGVVPLLSIEHYELTEHKVGVFCEAPVHVAARMITKRTHRVATPEEAVFHNADAARRNDYFRHLDMERKAANGQLAILQTGALPQAIASTVQAPLPAELPKKSVK